MTAAVSVLPTITGCNGAAFAAFPAGDIAVISRGTYTFATKATNAKAAGAAAVVTYNNAPGPLNGTLGADFALDIAVVSVEQTVGQQLAATAGLVAYATLQFGMTTEVVNAIKGKKLSPRIDKSLGGAEAGAIPKWKEFPERFSN